MRVLQSAAIFCAVIDNFGDVGVCWRLARQLAQQENLAVTLWVNDLAALKRLRPVIAPALSTQELDGFIVRQWQAEHFSHMSNVELKVADLVIEAFGCKLPEPYIEAMAKLAKPPVWINLEYLSAESWVESCHRLPSPHPMLPLKKYFYFPGFTAATGGLLKEAALDAQRVTLQDDVHSRAAWLDHLGVKLVADTTLVSLFCYPSAPLEQLFAAMQGGDPVLCLVPEGVAVEMMTGYLGHKPVSGARAVFGNLTLQVVPFLEPDDYDCLLSCCDLNFVRGEDSLVRAQWAARPFIWQAYAQEQSAHFDKLAALADRYALGLSAMQAATLRKFAWSWNGDEAVQMDWPAMQKLLPALRAHALKWQESLSAQTELAHGLVVFARQI